MHGDPIRPKPRQTGLTAICVDDTDADRFISVFMLQRTGLFGTIHDFVGAEDALAFLQSPDAPAVVDLFLTDVTMPKVGGVELLSSIAGSGLQTRFGKLALALTIPLPPADQDVLASMTSDIATLKKPLAVDAIKALLA